MLLYIQESQNSQVKVKVGNQVEICKEYLKSKYGSEYENIRFSVFEDEDIQAEIQTDLNFKN